MVASDLQRQFVEAARLHGFYRNEGNPTATNAAYDKAITALRALQTQPDRGQRFLFRFLENTKPIGCAFGLRSTFCHIEKRRQSTRSSASLGVSIVSLSMPRSLLLQEWRAGRLRVE